MRFIKNNPIYIKKKPTALPANLGVNNSFNSLCIYAPKTTIANENIIAGTIVIPNTVKKSFKFFM